MEDGVEGRGGGVSAKGERAGGHLVEHRAEGKNVGASVEVFAERLFGRHVGDGAESAARTGEVWIVGAGDGGAVGSGGGVSFGQTEVENFGVTTLGHEKICGLDVAMDDAFGVGGVEGIGNLDCQIEQDFELHRPRADAVFQGDAIEKFHGDEGFAVLVADVIDGADVGMVERGRGLGFALKTGERLRIAGDIVGKKFQGDETVKANVLGFIDDSHAATAELFGDAVVRDSLANHAVAVW